MKRKRRLCRFCKKHPVERRRAFCSLVCGRRFAQDKDPLPTPAEIAERSAAIREGWSDVERRRRRLGLDDDKCLLPDEGDHVELREFVHVAGGGYDEIV